MRPVGVGGFAPGGVRESVSGRLPGDLAATSSSPREYGNKQWVASIDAVHALDVALRCAYFRNLRHDLGEPQ